MIEASQVISDEVNIGSISTYREISLSLMKKNRRGRGEAFADLHVPERDLNDAGTRRVEVGNSRGSKGGGGGRGIWQITNKS